MIALALFFVFLIGLLLLCIPLFMMYFKAFLALSASKEGHQQLMKSRQHEIDVLNTRMNDRISANWEKIWLQWAGDETDKAITESRHLNLVNELRLYLQSILQLLK
jgi:hypothetical protein